jgi:hypothetical protein
MKLHTLTFVAHIILLSTSAARADDSKWGAIALDTAKAESEPYYGVGGGDDEQQAIDAAMGFCKEAGGADCKPLVSYEQCGALAVTGKGTAGWGKDTTKASAEAQALSGCNDPENCKIVVSDCNGG